MRELFHCRRDSRDSQPRHRCVCQCRVVAYGSPCWPVPGGSWHSSGMGVSRGVACLMSAIIGSRGSLQYSARLSLLRSGVKLDQSRDGFRITRNAPITGYARHYRATNPKGGTSARCAGLRFRYSLRFRRMVAIASRKYDSGGRPWFPVI